ncbi:uncharacterized protein [Chelonus insularis]|uniref:uncharacterized protein n=1 Tax=Chelonus insularis TaxID=460826 RepID=UPI00158CAC9D|nr:uncharacterized protein LOC118065426 [Chelonus insularis]
MVKEDETPCASKEAPTTKAKGKAKKLNLGVKEAFEEEETAVDVDRHVIVAKLPAFWKNKPDLWFMQVESIFRSKGIRSDVAKYDAVVGTFDSETIELATDILRNPPEENKYEYLKEHLIKRLTQSKEKQMQTLINDLQLGQLKPTQLLLKMRELAPRLDDEYLSSMWRNKLPQHVRELLTVTDNADLATLARVADNIMDQKSQNDGYVMAANAKSKTSEDLIDKRISKLEDLILSFTNEIKARLDTVEKMVNQRSRSRSRSKTPGIVEPCYYHKKFGEAATRCVFGCPLMEAEIDSAQPMPQKELRLHIQDRKTKINYLIDSGSVVSVLPRRLFPGSKLKESTNLKLFAVNDSQIPSYGNKIVELDLGLRRAFKWYFLIADVVAPIIGADFLVYYELMVDLKNKKLVDSKTTISAQGMLSQPEVSGISTVSGQTIFHALFKEFVEITQPRRNPDTITKSTVCHYITTIGQAKSEGEWRTCGDFRRLNAQTVPDQYSLPLIQSLFEKLHNKTIFLTLDLARAYNQIPMNKEDIEKTAIITPFDLFEYVFMPFDGYKPPQKRVEAIKNYPKPKTVSELRRFVGMINYYRCCIPRLAEKQVPLTEYLKKSLKNDKTIIEWSEKATKAFEESKDSLVKVTLSAYISLDAPLSLTTDASDAAICASLEQLEDNEWKPIGFFSRKLSKSEQNYSTYDRELLAIYAAIKHFQHILESRPFVIKTDHKPLTFAFKQRSDKALPRQLRHLDFISQFSTEIIHIKGNDNTIADAFSRIFAIGMPTVLSAARISEEQKMDEELTQILNDKMSLRLQKLVIEDKDVYCDASTGVVRSYIPASLRRQAFDVVYGLAHPSGRTTCKQLKEKFIWPEIRSDAIQWSRECVSCQRAKVHRHNKLIPNKIDVPDNRFNHIHIDIIHLPEVRGYQYCLTIIDRFSRFPMAIPLKDVTAQTVADAFFNNWVCLFGTPLTITPDQGSQFESALFNALLNTVSAKRIRTTPYHPASNGLVERWHRTLKIALMCHPNIPWVDVLPSVLLGLRTVYKEDLKASPAELLFGTTLRIPGEFFVHEDLSGNPEKFVEKL